MKIIFTILILTFSAAVFGQEKTDLENLIKLGELYSKNVNATGDEFKGEAEKLRTSGLNHIIDALIAVGNADMKLLTKEFLSKPPKQELRYWYVLREIHYNNQSKNSGPKPSLEIVKSILEEEIDSRWLLDNYYYRINGGIAKLFNEEDLSELDIDLGGYGLENETEKAILYFAISNALTQRFRVLQTVKNYDRLLEFASKLPTFNGKAYYEYTSFNFEDFEWIGYDKTESYKERHIGSLFSNLSGHFTALAEKEKIDEMRNLYFNSILFIPEYFKYSGGMESSLKELYSRSKK